MTTASSTPNLDELKDIVGKLKALLDDPQPGLISWAGFYDYQMRRLVKFWVGDEIIQPMELQKKGGEWLGAARDWMKCNTLNGDSVEWGSFDVLKPGMTVHDIEDLAAHVAAAVINEEHKRLT